MHRYLLIYRQIKQSLSWSGPGDFLHDQPMKIWVWTVWPLDNEDFGQYYVDSDQITKSGDIIKWDILGRPQGPWWLLGVESLWRLLHPSHIAAKTLNKVETAFNLTQSQQTIWAMLDMVDAQNQSGLTWEVLKNRLAHSTFERFISVHAVSHHCDLKEFVSGVTRQLNDTLFFLQTDTLKLHFGFTSGKSTFQTSILKIAQMLKCI